MVPVFLVPLAILLHFASLARLGITQPTSHEAIGLAPIASVVR
jgi:hypothetical protein